MIAQGSVKNRNVGKGSKCKFHISIQTVIIREGGESKAVKLSMPLSIVQGLLAKIILPNQINFSDSRDRNELYRIRISHA